MTGPDHTDGRQYVSEERLRIKLGIALVPFADDEGPDLFEWHPCVDTPACRAIATPPGPCACSGIAYLSDAAWAAICGALGYDLALIPRQPATGDDT